MLPNHWWENRFWPDVTPLDTIKRKLREWCWKIRVDLCFDENDGFDVGLFVGHWKRARGPFLLHRTMVGPHDEYALGPWRLMIALSPKAWDGFDDGCCK